MTCFPFVTGCDFNIIPNSPDDQTVKLQEMFDTAANECIEARLKAGVYWVTTLLKPRGLYLRGAGLGGTVNTKGTVFAQHQGVNASLIKSAVLPANEWHHWGGMEGIHLYKEPASEGVTPDTIGHGIDMEYPVGEDLRFQRVMIENFPQSGLRYRKGGTPVWINDLHVFRCGEYAIDLEKGGGDRLHCCSIERISGDNNGRGMIHLKTVGDLNEQVSIKHIKAEASIAGRHPHIFVFEDISQIGIDIEHVGGVVLPAATAGADALVRIVGIFTGRVHMKNAYINGYESALRDHRTNADAGQQARNFPMTIAGESFSFPMLYGNRSM